MKIRYFLAAAFASISLLASAGAETDPMYMVLTMKNGQLKAVNIGEVNRLTFPDGKMSVEKKDASTEQIVLTDIDRMEFSNSQTGAIASVESGADFAFDAQTSTLCFKGVNGKELAVYDTKGALVLRLAAAEGTQTLDLSAIGKGVYIVTYNGKTLKIKK